MPSEGNERVRRATTGDPGAYEALVERHHPRLYRFALGMLGDPGRARAIVEDVLVGAFEDLADCPGDDAFGIWALGLLRDACRAEEAPGGKIGSRGPTHATPSPRPPPSTLEEAVQVLPEAELREAFLLFHVEGLPYEELVGLLQVDEDELRRRVHRAREVLRTGVDPSHLPDDRA